MIVFWKNSFYISYVKPLLWPYKMIPQIIQVYNDTRPLFNISSLNGMCRWTSSHQLKLLPSVFLCIVGKIFMQDNTNFFKPVISCYILINMISLCSLQPTKSKFKKKNQAGYVRVLKKHRLKFIFMASLFLRTFCILKIEKSNQNILKP